VNFNLFFQPVSQGIAHRAYGNYLGARSGERLSSVDQLQLERLDRVLPCGQLHQFEHADAPPTRYGRQRREAHEKRKTDDARQGNRGETDSSANSVSGAMKISPAKAPVQKTTFCIGESRLKSSGKSKFRGYIDITWTLQSRRYGDLARYSAWD
jgi:hypothetical protein